MIRIRQIKIAITDDNPENIMNKIAAYLQIKKKDISSYIIRKKSLDARKRDDIKYVYDFDVSIKNEAIALKRHKDWVIARDESFTIRACQNPHLRPVIVGAGPAGLFAALTFVAAGLKPIIIERGDCVEKRIEKVNAFWEKNVLDENSNVQFGEGGAGTFSDGKLNTLVKDKDYYGRACLETFVHFGADAEILYSYKPHIGTDVLVNVIKNMRTFLLSKGATIQYNSCMTDIITEDNHVKAIIINNNKTLECSKLVLAIGHSARDTFRLLNRLGLKMQSKPFAIGLRIEHLQAKINESQYGTQAAKILGPANYKLTYQSSNGHGVYSFCMCPGGYVVNASSKKNRLAINGMSYNKRDSKNANSALVITVNEHDYGNNLFSGLEFQEKLEASAYTLGNGHIPLQLLGDYYENKKSTTIKSVKPCIKGTYNFANLNELLPNELNIALKEAITFFDNKIKGFKDPEALLTGIESRTSSPIKILRNESFFSNIEGIYPCGEGAGYAGGIQSSAIDGIKVAASIIESQ